MCKDKIKKEESTPDNIKVKPLKWNNTITVYDVHLNCMVPFRYWQGKQGVEEKCG